MFIHIGNNNVIRSRNIISIIDHNVTTSSSVIEEMIQAKSKEKKTMGSKPEAKSVVITHDIIYYSSLSVTTLKKRSSMITMIKKFEQKPNEL